MNYPIIYHPVNFFFFIYPTGFLTTRFLYAPTSVTFQFFRTKNMWFSKSKMLREEEDEKKCIEKEERIN